MVYTDNAFLSSLSGDDQQALRPLFSTVTLVRRDVLMVEGRLVDRVYFPVSCVISHIISVEEGKGIEATTIGRDGALCVSPALDSRVSLSRGVVKIGGVALACEASAFKKVVLNRSNLLSAMIRHEQTLLAQAQQHVACGFTHKVSQQLARVLLRTRDLLGSDTLPLTQQHIAEHLGARRTSVTQAASSMREDGMIDYTRGQIRILAVAALKRASCECYSAVKRDYNAMLKLDFDR